MFMQMRGIVFSQILKCNVLPDSMEIPQHITQLAFFQKLFDRFKEMATFNDVTSKDVQESFQATIGMPRLTLVLTLLIP